MVARVKEEARGIRRSRKLSLRRVCIIVGKKWGVTCCGGEKDEMRWAEGERGRMVAVGECESRCLSTLLHSPSLLPHRGHTVMIGGLDVDGEGECDVLCWGGGGLVE